MTLALLSRTVLEDLGGVIGAEKLQRLLVRFTDSLRTAFPSGCRAPEDVAREAHTLVSMSGMLGCERLSDACRALEVRAKDGAELGPALAEIRALRDETVRALEGVANAPLMRVRRHGSGAAFPSAPVTSDGKSPTTPA